MSNIYYFTFKVDSILEGGMARNNAFHQKFKQVEAKIINVYDSNFIIRFFKLIKFLFSFLTLKNKRIFIHQGALLLVFPIFLFKYKLPNYLIKKILQKTIKRNKLYIEVNDLAYYQSIDLKLAVNPNYLIYDELIFSLNKCNYIFASSKMKEFILSKYKLTNNNCQIIKNGAPRLDSDIIKSNIVEISTNEQITYIYAGSLNKGRNIEEILSMFYRQKHAQLVLMGKDGEWLLEKKLPENIRYIGSFNEEDAHQIVSQCDIGLIPYDDSKFYYNLCFPIKVAFYITAGIPVLSTKLEELMLEFQGKNIIQFESIENWPDAITSITKDHIKIYKRDVAIQKKNYYWDVLLNNLEI